MILLCIILITITGCSVYYAYTTKNNCIQKDIETKEENQELKIEQTKLQESLKQLSEKAKEAGETFNKLTFEIKTLADKKEELNKTKNQLEIISNKIEILTNQENQLKAQINKSKEAFDKLFENYSDALDDSYVLKENEYDDLCEQLEESYDKLQDKMIADYNEKRAKIQTEIAENQAVLDKISATRKSAIEAQRREEEIAINRDFYTLTLSTNLFHDIKLFDSIKDALIDKRPLLMAVWTAYYNKPANDLAARVLGPKPVCGIYKITHTSGLAYIGQAVDIRERWRTHMKCGLGIDTPSNNKLYNAMLKESLTAFTFELLEECSVKDLNEKERFYIELYDTYHYGYNSTSGNKGEKK